MAAFDLKKRLRTLRGGQSGLGSGRRCFEIAFQYLNKARKLWGCGVGRMIRQWARELAKR